MSFLNITNVYYSEQQTGKMKRWSEYFTIHWHRGTRSASFPVVLSTKLGLSTGCRGCVYVPLLVMLLEGQQHHEQ